MRWAAEAALAGARSNPDNELLAGPATAPSAPIAFILASCAIGIAPRAVSAARGKIGR